MSVWDLPLSNSISTEELKCQRQVFHKNALFRYIKPQVTEKVYKNGPFSVISKNVMTVAAHCHSSCFPVCVLVGSSALGQFPLPHVVSSLAHEGLVLPLVGKQSQEHGILLLIEAEVHAKQDTIQ